MMISNLISGNFIERPNRFTVVFETDDKLEKAHLKDPGRLRELLTPNAKLLLKAASDSSDRKTKYDVVAVLKDDIWVVINSGFHSDIASDLIKSEKIEEFSGYFVKKEEYTYSKSRIDFLLSNNEKEMLVEVKGCTLVKNGVALFPDAPTSRGRKHLKELIRAKKEGLKSAVLFLIMREDALEFSPNYRMDPDFSRALLDAYQNGVLVIAYSVRNIYKKNILEVRPFKRVKVKL